MSITGDRLSVTRGYMSRAGYMATIATQWAQEGLEQFTESQTSITAATRFVPFGCYDHYFESY